MDVVLGADITYDVRLIPSLLGTLRDLVELFPKVDIIICVTERNVETLEAFIQQCQVAGFDVEDVGVPLETSLQQQGPFYNTAVPIRTIRCSVRGMSQFGQELKVTLF